MSGFIYGIGYNSGGKHKTSEYGKRTKIYSDWKGMFRRCYSQRSLSRNPTYTACTVADEWHDYQAFAEWRENHKYGELGYELDKDLLVAGNKTYSPETCCLIPQEINKLLNKYEAARGEYPRGVYFKKSRSKYIASISIDSKVTHLGVFHCPSEAHQAYATAKEAYVKEVANKWRGRIDERVYDALMNWTVK